MKIVKEDIDWAISEGILSSEQGEFLWNALQKRTSNRPQFNFANVAYYFGAFIVLAGMTWFMSLAWEQFGEKGLLFLACLYAFLFVLAGQTLWFKQNLKIPGGLLFTIAVCMTPIAIFGLLAQLNLGPTEYQLETAQTYRLYEKVSVMVMALGTILAGLITLRFVKFPFLLAPITWAAWLVSRELYALMFFPLTQKIFWTESNYWNYVWFGLACLVVAYWVDWKTSRSQEDYAFWIYLFGLIFFWLGMTFMSDGGPNKIDPLLYFVINLGLMLLSVLLQRRSFIVFGAIGVFYYLYYVFYKAFQNSLLFPLTLMVLGLLVIYAGIQYQRNEKAIEQLIVGKLPMSVRQILPRRRA